MKTVKIILNDQEVVIPEDDLKWFVDHKGAEVAGQRLRVAPPVKSSNNKIEGKSRSEWEDMKVYEVERLVKMISEPSTLQKLSDWVDTKGGKKHVAERLEELTQTQ